MGDGYLEGLERRAILPAAVERRLVLAAQAGDPVARGQLVEAFMPLIAAAARPYRNLHVQRVELLQEGVVGLLRALEGFDRWSASGRSGPTRPGGCVRPCSSSWPSSPGPSCSPTAPCEASRRLREAHNEALGESGAEPSRGELAQRTGLSLDQVDDLMATERPVRSLEEPLPGEDGVVGAFGDLHRRPAGRGGVRACDRGARDRGAAGPAGRPLATGARGAARPLSASTARRRACARSAAGSA